MRQDAAEAEATLERIWDLHDRLSDAILAASRARLLLPSPPHPHPAPSGGGRNGFVFVKGGGDEVAAAAAEAAAEARSLHTIRSALEDLEGHLEFLHVRLLLLCSPLSSHLFESFDMIGSLTQLWSSYEIFVEHLFLTSIVVLQTVQSQQRAEWDAAIARLEQSRLVLAMKLTEHQGKKYGVIDDALKFVGEASDKSRFISPEDVCATCSQSENNAEDNTGNHSRIVANMLSCSLSLVKNSFRLDNISGALGNAAVFAASMLAFLQLHQVASGSKTPAMGYSFQSGSSQQNGKGKHLEVYLTRG
ncbi:hypothetical protein PR202_gb17239 [Eleusine coracana subsp. coracana]|uniref:Uncharacterized protein n=1 Tax=Eleusine coracana subsp. coracana TaxID=191504 RepID=A0AAV5F305_ELECO|nr:hypothetical protein PR202_gb17239 [Eleusine coracana subsp. coracana]